MAKRRRKKRERKFVRCPECHILMHRDPDLNYKLNSLSHIGKEHICGACKNKPKKQTFKEIWYPPYNGHDCMNIWTAFKSNRARYSQKQWKRHLDNLTSTFEDDRVKPKVRQLALSVCLEITGLTDRKHLRSRRRNRKRKWEKKSQSPPQS